MNHIEIGRPGLAAVTFSEHGGGIAAVSRLLQRVLNETLDRPVLTFALSPNRVRFDTGTAARIAFGARIALAQMAGHCDWMLFTHLSLATAQARIPSRVRRPYAVFLHDIEAWTPLSPFRRRVLAGAFLRLANSQYTAHRVVEANPTCGPVEACPLALPSDPDDAPAFDRLPFDVGPRTVVIVGRMAANERYKGHDQLLEAWPQVVADVPDARLLCVGEGDDVPRLREKAHALGVAHAVLFPGFVDDATKRAIYQRVSALAMPSRREGFGLVYLEAMAARLPCIGSLHDAAPDVIVDGETGYLVSQDDGALLARRVIELLKTDRLRRRLGDAGYERYRREFSYDVFRRRVTAQIMAALPKDGRVSARTAARNA